MYFANVRAQGDKIVNGFWGPQERHTFLGAGRSLRVSQEATICSRARARCPCRDRAMIALW